MDLRAFYFQAAEAAAMPAEGDAAPSEAALLKTMEVQQGQSGGASPVGVNGGSAGSCEGGGLICPECGKAFLSDKAMYGHLRCHPERRYKGAIRPATPVVASASAVSHGDAKARKVPWLEIALPTKWPLTAKRGRTPTVSTSVCAEPVSVLESSCCGEEEEEEAAKTLLDLAQHARCADQLELPAGHLADAVAVTPGPEQPVVPDVVAGADALQHVQQEAQMPAPVEHIFGIILGPQAPPGQSNFMSASEPANNSAAFVMVREEDKTVSPGAKKPKKRRLHDPVVSQTPDSSQPANPEELRPPVIRRIPSQASDRRYTCPTCFKSFPTHQALGGHMANHNRTIRQHADGLAVAQAVHNIWAHRQRHEGANAGTSGLVEDLQISLQPPPPPPPPKSHTCSRCCQIFSTGQALGGHMRKHFLGERLQAAAAAPGTAPPALAAATAEVPAAQDGGPRCRDFDLNEMMPWE